MSAKKFLFRSSRRKANAFKTQEEQDFLSNFSFSLSTSFIIIFIEDIRKKLMKDKAYVNLSNRSIQASNIKFKRNDNSDVFLTQRRSRQPVHIHNRINPKI